MCRIPGLKHTKQKAELIGAKHHEMFATSGRVLV